MPDQLVLVKWSVHDFFSPLHVLLELAPPSMVPTYASLNLPWVGAFLIDLDVSLGVSST